MKFSGLLITVTDMEASKRFYDELFGLKVLDDFGANVRLDGEIYLQTIETWKRFIHTDEIKLKNNAVEMYFTEGDMDGFIKKLKNYTPTVELVHSLVEHEWGQFAIRIYDPDHHIIEIAENLSTVINRFLDTGMTPAQVANRMDVSEAYVLETMHNQTI